MNKRKEISLLGTIAFCAVVLLLRQLLKIEEDKNSANSIEAGISEL